MMLLTDLRDTVVRPTLDRLGLGSPAAIALVLGTAVQESGLGALKQLGGGPARGFWQIEPFTHNDVVERLSILKPHLHERLSEIVGIWPSRIEQLSTNLCYGAAICRLKYYLIPEALPEAGDVDGLAAYWKTHFNTRLGKGRPEQWAKSFRQYVAHILTA